MKQNNLKNYTFSIFNSKAEDGITTSLKEIGVKKEPIIVCVGSDLVVGDSMGPLIGTLLKRKGINAYVYGTLGNPITAKEINYIKSYIKNVHKENDVIAIDAAVGCEDDVGLIKVFNNGIKPGLGVNKNLDTIGDTSIIGIVASKSVKNYNLFNKTRLSLVYNMAEKIANAINKYINYQPEA